MNNHKKVVVLLSQGLVHPHFAQRVPWKIDLIFYFEFNILGQIGFNA